MYLYLYLYLYSTVYIVGLCSKGLPFPALPSGAHTTCLLGWVKLVPSHSCCCPWWCSIVLASPKCWGICNKVTLPVPSPGLSSRTVTLPHSTEPSRTPSVLGLLLYLILYLHQWPLIKNSSPAAQFQASCLQKQYDFRNFNITKFSCQHKLQPWLLLDHSFSMLTLQKVVFSSSIPLLKYSWLFSPSWPVSVAPVKQRFHFRGLTLWMTADISAPADQNHTVLKFKISNSPHIVFKGFPKLPLKRHKPSFNSIPIFQLLTTAH